MMDESLPCPVCGGRAWAHYEPTTIRIHCPCCDILRPEKNTIDEARAAWNALPRALTWTTEPPKVPGWYWFKDDLFCKKGGIMRITDVWIEEIKKTSGPHDQWAGPIPEPREPKE